MCDGIIHSVRRGGRRLAEAIRGAARNVCMLSKHQFFRRFEIRCRCTSGRRRGLRMRTMRHDATDTHASGERRWWRRDSDKMSWRRVGIPSDDTYRLSEVQSVRSLYPARILETRSCHPRARRTPGREAQIEGEQKAWGRLCFVVCMNNNNDELGGWWDKFCIHIPRALYEVK